MKYFLLSSQRSGSALLRHSLLNLFGENNDGPAEWIDSPITRRNLGLPEDFNRANEIVLNNTQLLVDRMSHNSHRKVMYNQILKPDNIPQIIPVIHLIRKDTWAQTKSSWIMRQKKSPPHVDDEAHQQLSSQNIKLQLLLKEVRNIAKMMLNQKHFWYQALIRRPNTLTLFYEDDLCDINIFMRETLPRIEAFLKKKRVIENFKFKFKKTSLLYTIENNVKTIVVQVNLLLG